MLLSNKPLDFKDCDALWLHLSLMSVHPKLNLSEQTGCYVGKLLPFKSSEQKMMALESFPDRELSEENLEPLGNSTWRACVRCLSRKSERDGPKIRSRVDRLGRPLH
jgi:hypothetical protein